MATWFNERLFRAKRTLGSRFLLSYAALFLKTVFGIGGAFYILGKISLAFCF